MIAAIWICTGTGLLLWSLLAWGLYGLLRLAPGWAGDVKPWLERVPLHDWLENWLPGWRGLAEALLDLAQALLSLLGTALGSYAPWLVWGSWAVGALVMVAFAALLHLAVRAAARPTQLSSAR